MDSSPETPSSSRPTLDELANKYNTSKGTQYRGGTFGGYGYAPIYDQMFTPFRDDHLRLFEIGVQTGASLRMWREYFPNAEIVGMDIEAPIEIPGCTVLQGDQGNVFDLDRIPGTFDIIIDDGSHLSQHQLTSFYFLCPFKMNDKGIYIIEDLNVIQGRGVAMNHFRTQFSMAHHHGVQMVTTDGIGRLLFFYTGENLRADVHVHVP